MGGPPSRKPDDSTVSEKQRAVPDGGMRVLLIQLQPLVRRVEGVEQHKYAMAAVGYTFIAPPLPQAGPHPRCNPPRSRLLARPRGCWGSTDVVGEAVQCTRPECVELQ
jgi:hypothetical protein